MTYEIEKGVPLPLSRAANGLSAALRKMGVGDSVLVPLDGTSVAPVAWRVGKEVGGKFSLRRTEGGYRVWRVS